MKTPLRIPKLHSELENITPNWNSPLQIRKLHSQSKIENPESSGSLVRGRARGRGRYIIYTMNDLILFDEYIHSHSRSNFLFTTVAIFIQHFVRIPLYASLNPRLLHASGNTFFEDTRIPNNVFLVSMDTPRGILKSQSL